MIHIWTIKCHSPALYASNFCWINWANSTFRSQSLEFTENKTHQRWWSLVCSLTAYGIIPQLAHEFFEFSIESFLIMNLNTYRRYRTDGYSPKVAHSVATCSAMRSIWAKRAPCKLGEYKHWNVSGESSENTCWFVNITHQKEEKKRNNNILELSISQIKSTNCIWCCELCITTLHSKQNEGKLRKKQSISEKMWKIRFTPDPRMAKMQC